MKFLFRMGSKKKKKDEVVTVEAVVDGEGLQVGITDLNGPDLSVEDFTLLAVLGRGSFGKVMLVTRNGDATNQLLAMKTLRKAALIKRNQLIHTATERYVLQHVDHPFLARLVYAFQTREKLYMVLDYLSGGELFYWLKKHRRFSEPRARLYAAEIGLGLEALHDVDIVYRDLKPENLLLDAEGHICITDFGLSKEHVTSSSGGATTFCGTPEYLAPEILENKGHGKAVDWWSFGTLLYEMICGLPPFYDVNVQTMYRKILQAPLKFPAHLSTDAQTLLQALLQRKVDDRLGSAYIKKQDDEEENKEGDPPLLLLVGFGAIRGADFFAKFLDFEKVFTKQYKPEFRPPAATRRRSTHKKNHHVKEEETEGNNFDTQFTREAPIDSVVTGGMTPAQAEVAKFSGFTFSGMDDDNDPSS